MADAEEKAKAEKLAAAKKRVAQLQKQKQKSKKGGKKAAGESSKEAPPVEPASTAEKEEEPTPQHPEKEPEQKQDYGELDESQAVSKEEPSVAEPAEPAEPTESEKPEEDEVSQLKNTHRRQPSLSIQSKMRSSSFRRSSVSQQGLTPGSASGVKSPPLPPLSPDGSTAPELFRKQSQRLEEVEKENKRLEKELETADARWKKSEESLDELREASSETIELKEKLATAEKKAAEVEKLKAEISALQRQNSHLQTRSNKSAGSTAGGVESPTSELQSQLDSKSATIEAMELEISNLRAQLNDSTDDKKQISDLRDQLAQAKVDAEKEVKEHASTKEALNRVTQKAMSEGVSKASTDTLVSSLQRELAELKTTKGESDKKITALEKKLEALGNLHKESEIRHQTRLRERDKFEKDSVLLRKKLVTVENENLRLREERDRIKKREASGGEHDEALDELEDEERSRLERKVRELEGEIFDLRRGIWKEKRRELAAGNEDAGPEDVDDQLSTDFSPSGPGGGSFDDVDLTGGWPSGPDHSRRRSLAANKPRQHSSFATVLSSGLAAFTGAAGHDAHPGRRSLDLISEKEGSAAGFLEDEDDGFDEDAFARAQAVEESRKRTEWEKDVKRKLAEWKGWRLDLVECRYGAQGAGVGLGEIFDI